MRGGVSIAEEWFVRSNFGAREAHSLSPPLDIEASANCERAPETGVPNCLKRLQFCSYKNFFEKDVAPKTQ